MSVKGFWFRPSDPARPLAAAPIINWPYWHDADDEDYDGATDWGFRPTYCNGNFWDGLRRAFAGRYQPCGVLRMGGESIREVTYQRMLCCQSPRTPWRYRLDFSGLFATYADSTTGRESGSVRLVSAGGCGWQQEPGEGIEVSWTFYLVPAGTPHLHIQKNDADGNLVWVAEVDYELIPHTDAYDATDLLAIPLPHEEADSLLFVPIELSAGCEGGSLYFLTEFGTPIISEAEDLVVTET